MCNHKGKVKRLISICSGKVELSGFELKKHLKEEGRKLKEDMYRSEKTYSNMLGEDRYEQIQKHIDKQK